MRSILLLLHRYLGLVLVPFLIIIGLTGSIIIFFEDLDAWANPDLRHVTPHSQRLDPLDIREQLELAEPHAHFYAIRFPQFENEAMYFYTEPALNKITGEEYSIAHDQVYANPYTGDRLGERMWGDLSFDSKDWFTFIYFLHYSLILPETWGEIFMGTIALLWIFDSFVALYLTLPGGRRKFWSRWKSAWKIKTGTSQARTIYDLHRSVGLWVWVMVLLYAWSGFSFNMPRAYSTVVGHILEINDNNTLPLLDQPLTEPSINWQQAYALGKTYITEQAKLEGFSVNRESMLIYRRETGIYDYRVNSTRDIRTHQDYGYTSVAIDAMTGELRGTSIPSGQYSGNTFTSWIKSLHTAVIFGWPLKVLNSFVGLMVVVLSVTGVLIWLRKRRIAG